jgi:exodeoxyribonuclease V alpha subunit
MTLPYPHVQLALRAPGLLARFNTAGVLTAADVHIATRLAALVGETNEQMMLAAALAVRSTRHGSVVTDLTSVASTAAPDPDDNSDAPEAADLPWPQPDTWTAACAGSPLTVGPDAPLRQRGPLLWLARYDTQEQKVADEACSRTLDTPNDLDPTVLRAGLDRLFPTPADADQRLAAAVCALSRISVLAGGPGTGKTTTVARLLALLREQHPTWRIALAAPTGKAAARLDEAVAQSTTRLSEEDRQLVGQLEGVTLHRLLGWRAGSRSRFRHDHDNRLPYEVVVVDEASMVSLTMMARLLETLRPTSRLILVGDPDQLASVEAGAVLGDIVDREHPGARTASFITTLDAAAPDHGSTHVETTPATRLRDGIATLTVNRRFDASSAIGALASAVRAGLADEALAVLRAGGPDVEFVEIADDAPPSPAVLATVEHDVVAWAVRLRTAALANDHDAALQALDSHRLLCAHRRGPRGTQHWATLAQRWLIAADPNLMAMHIDGHYPGQPLLVTTNDYDVGLFNGDTGVVVAHATSDEPASLQAWFTRGGTPIAVPVVRLGAVQQAYAMTVHRSQGAQFDRVTTVLPRATSALANRETLYTALTRAVNQVRVIGSAQAIATAVARPAARATGLRMRLEA